MIAHEYANLFPMMLESDLVRLAEDIKEKGQSDPVITLDGKILDGRNRFKACQLNGITPRCEEYAGDDPLGFVISHNLHRRHLTEPQRAMVAERLANLENGQRPDRVADGIPTAKAAAMLNVSRDSVTQARKIAKQGSPELNEAVMQGGVSLAAAVDVSSLPHDEQAAVVAKGADAVKSKAKEIRQQASEPAEESEPLVVDGLYPTPDETTLSSGDIKRGEDAGKDSEKLSLLKSTWNKASKKDRAIFAAWINKNWKL